MQRSARRRRPCRCPAGCSGYVAPGAPRSAEATPVLVAIRTAVTVTVRMRRFIRFLRCARLTLHFDPIRLEALQASAS
jgi:hypothetical protein